MKRGLVLSGGSIKGAFQAGAVSQLLASNRFIPDIVTGTSVGSLNGMFLAERSGRYRQQNQPVDWPTIGNDLKKFWIDNITSFDAVGKKIGTIKLVWQIIRNQFNGFVDMTPLYKLLDREFDMDVLTAGPIEYYSCSVNLYSSELILAHPKTHKPFMDHLIASTAIPLQMPFRNINKQPHVDGGLRDVAPLTHAIDKGAEQIVCICCHPETMQDADLEWGNILKYIDRNMAIMTNETVNTDIRECRHVNELLKEFGNTGSLRDKRPIKLTVIRPQTSLPIHLDDFDRDDIKACFDRGWDMAANTVV